MRNFYLLFIGLLFTNLSYTQNTLTLNLEVGKVYTHVFGSKSQTNNQFGERISSSENTFIYSNSYKVISFENDFYTLVLNIDSVSAEIDSGEMGTFSFNSESKEESLGNNMLKNLKKMNLIVTVDKYGENLRVKSDSAMRAKMFEEMRNSRDRSSMAGIAQLRNFMNDRGIQQFIEPMFNIYPKQNIYKGYNWEEEWTDEDRMSKTKVTAYSEVFELDDEFAVIRMERKYSPANVEKEEEKKAEVSPQGGRGRGMRAMRSNFKMNGFSYLDIKIDRKSGWIYSLSIEEEKSGSAELPDDSPMQGSFSMSIKSILQGFGTW
jgi:hypothetical protein